MADEPILVDMRLTPEATIPRLMMYAHGDEGPSMELLAHDLVWAAQLRNVSLPQIQKAVAAAWQRNRGLARDASK